MKDASHLAIVAWTENKRKPDQSILDSFEVQKIEEKGKGTFINPVSYMDITFVLYRTYNKLEFYI